MRHICYLSGTRADFGLMRHALKAMHDADDLRLSVVVTGMHLQERYGLTVREIEASGLTVARRIPADVEADVSGASMARGISSVLAGVSEALEQLRPDMVLLLGDRGEMLAGAIAALHLNIPVVHVHGGERSGTIDESVRHAISKLSHFHFVATEESRDRLVRMGEEPSRVFVTGAPGLDGLQADAAVPRRELIASMRFDPRRPVALMLFHPVVQEAVQAGVCATAILACLERQGCQIIALRPNSDAGSLAVEEVLERHKNHPSVRVVTHLPRSLFVSWLAAADLLIGNSSSGIIEAASFGLPVINVGSRQNLRQRNANVLDVPADPVALDAAVSQALAHGRYASDNVYGDGKAANRMVDLIRRLPVDPAILSKVNAY